jgi:hypothetical protein
MGSTVNSPHLRQNKLTCSQMNLFNADLSRYERYTLTLDADFANNQTIWRLHHNPATIY